MFGVKETDKSGPNRVADEQTASSSPLWFPGRRVIMQTVCQKKKKKKVPGKPPLESGSFLL